MNRIFLSALASVALSCASAPEILGEHGHHHEHHGHHAHHDKMDAGKTAEEMAKECEDRMGKIKDAGASLSPDMKAEFDYNLEIAGIEIKALRDVNHKDHKKHDTSCHRHLSTAEHILKKHEHQLAHEKKMEERKAKAAERKARADERKAKAEERKAKREADKAAHKAAAHHEHHHAKEATPALESAHDNGRTEGADTRAPGSEAEKLAAEEKK
jgi:hypothetical protein